MTDPKKLAAAFRVAVVFLALNTTGLVWAGDDTPEVIREGETPVLVLPPSLTEFIAARFPDLRVPTHADMTGDWATYRKKDAVPYACWGDFNGDGLTDVALFLIGEMGRWKVVAFHQTQKGEYVEFTKVVRLVGSTEYWYRSHPPQGLHIYTVNAGEIFKVDGNVARRTPYKFDSIAFFFLQDPMSGLHFTWNAVSRSINERAVLHGMYLGTEFGALDFTD